MRAAGEPDRAGQCLPAHHRALLPRHVLRGAGRRRVAALPGDRPPAASRVLAAGRRPRGERQQQLGAGEGAGGWAAAGGVRGEGGRRGDVQLRGDRHRRRPGRRDDRPAATQRRSGGVGARGGHRLRDADVERDGRHGRPRALRARVGSGGRQRNARAPRAHPRLHARVHRRRAARTHRVPVLHRVHARVAHRPAALRARPHALRRVQRAGRAHAERDAGGARPRGAGRLARRGVRRRHRAQVAPPAQVPHARRATCDGTRVQHRAAGTSADAAQHVTDVSDWSVAGVEGATGLAASLGGREPTLEAMSSPASQAAMDHNLYIKCQYSNVQHPSPIYIYTITYYV